jgi:CheY-like chemotaxis protein
VTFEWRYAHYNGAAVVPVLIENAVMPNDNNLPPELRWIAKRNAYALRPSSLEPDIDAVVKAIPAMAVEPRRVARVLWVDDNPANNELERAKLRPFGIVFDNVVSTDEAVEQLAFESYDLVITDLGRERSSDRSFTAGSAFLDHPSVKKGRPTGDRLRRNMGSRAAGRTRPPRCIRCDGQSRAADQHGVANVGSGTRRTGLRLESLDSTPLSGMRPGLLSVIANVGS